MNNVVTTFILIRVFQSNFHHAVLTFLTSSFVQSSFLPASGQRTPLRLFIELILLNQNLMCAVGKTSDPVMRVTCQSGWLYSANKSCRVTIAITRVLTITHTSLLEWQAASRPSAQQKMFSIN
jgi:hypothetical protein